MFILNDEQTMLRDGARQMIAATAPVSSLRKLLRDADGPGFDAGFWRECTAMGLPGVSISAEHGGSGFGLAGAGIVARETGRTLAHAPLCSGTIAATALAGSDAPAAADWLGRVAVGGAIVALAVDEDGAHRPDDAFDTAVTPGAETLLSGAKSFVLDGMEADAFIVAAGCGEGPRRATGLYLVEASQAGVSRAAVRLVDGRKVATVEFDRVAIPRSHVLAGENAGIALLESALDAGRAFLAARLCGIAEEAFERTVAYTRERRQFERSIASFQALQHRMALMHCEIEDAWSASLQALRALDSGAADAALRVAVAKAKASDVAVRSTAECLQLHGGIGMTDEFDIGLFLKQARVDGELLGGYSFHAERVAAALGF